MLAVGLKLTALMLFTSMSALVKALSEDFPPGELVFFRSLFAIPVIIIWLIWRGELAHGFVVKKPMGHFWRGVLGTSAMGLTFTGLSLLPLPEVTATIGALCVLCATMARAFVQIHIRQLVKVDHPAAIAFYFSVTATLLSALTAFWGWTMPTLNQALILVTMGFIGGVAQILVTSAYRFGQASMLAPYDYTSMLFAIIIGYVWFDELPTIAILTGAALVIAGNIVVIWREHQLGLERGKAQSLSDHKP